MSASCSVHAEREAGATCSRCGTFVCTTCMPTGATICAACTKRFDGEPLDQAIHWATARVSRLKLATGLTSTLVGISLCLAVVFSIRSWLVGGAIGAGLAAMVIGLGRGVSALLVRVFAPYWISRAQKRFGLPDDVLMELRVVLR